MSGTREDPIVIDDEDTAAHWNLDNAEFRRSSTSRGEAPVMNDHSTLDVWFITIAVVMEPSRQPRYFGPISTCFRARR